MTDFPATAEIDKLVRMLSLTEEEQKNWDNYREMNMQNAKKRPDDYKPNFQIIPPVITVTRTGDRPMAYKPNFDLIEEIIERKKFKERQKELAKEVLIDNNEKKVKISKNSVKKVKEKLDKTAKIKELIEDYLIYVRYKIQIFRNDVKEIVKELENGKN